MLTVNQFLARFDRLSKMSQADKDKLDDLKREAENERQYKREGDSK